MSELLPTRSNCRNCGTEFNVVRVETFEPLGYDLTCLVCGAPLQPREGKFALRYSLVTPPGSNAARSSISTMTRWGRPSDRVGETPCVFLAGLYQAERTIAERLMRLANGKLPRPWIDPDKALPWVEGRIGLALAERPCGAPGFGGEFRKQGDFQEKQEGD